MRGEGPCPSDPCAAGKRLVEFNLGSDRDGAGDGNLNAADGDVATRQLLVRLDGDARGASSRAVALLASSCTRRRRRASAACDPRRRGRRRGSRRPRPRPWTRAPRTWRSRWRGTPDAGSSSGERERAVPRRWIARRRRAIKGVRARARQRARLPASVGEAGSVTSASKVTSRVSLSPAWRAWTNCSGAKWKPRRARMIEHTSGVGSMESSTSNASPPQSTMEHANGIVTPREQFGKRLRGNCDGTRACRRFCSSASAIAGDDGRRRDGGAPDQSAVSPALAARLRHGHRFTADGTVHPARISIGVELGVRGWFSLTVGAGIRRQRRARQAARVSPTSRPNTARRV